jgi:hypothetical protein
LLHATDLGAGVPPLPALRAGRLHDLLGVEAAQERRLHAEHVGDLTHGVQGRVCIVDG